MDLVERVARTVATPILHEFDGWDTTKPVDWERIPKADHERLQSIARAAIAEMLDAMGEVSEGMTHAGFMAREHRMNMGESANATWQAMLAQFKAENVK